MTSLSASTASWRTLLRLGRVSNLPTVWTNTLAGTLLVGGDWHNARTLIVVVAMSLFYEGGMFLNDYFDREIDARERPEQGRFRRSRSRRPRSLQSALACSPRGLPCWRSSASRRSGSVCCWPRSSWLTTYAIREMRLPRS